MACALSAWPLPSCRPDPEADAEDLVALGIWSDGKRMIALRDERLTARMTERIGCRCILLGGRHVWSDLRQPNRCDLHTLDCAKRHAVLR